MMKAGGWINEPNTMNNADNICPKCKGEMEKGFILDVTHGYRLVSQWMAGEAEKSFWGIKVRGKRQKSIRTWRCTSCGYLESYA